MVNEVMGKKLRFMSQNKFETITEADDELYAVNGSGIGFPSSRYENLILGASGTEYTAPANGWFDLRKGASSGQYIKLIGKVESCVNSSGQVICAFLPIRKGQKVKVDYTATGTTHTFRFVYAEGE